MFPSATTSESAEQVEITQRTDRWIHSLSFCLLAGLSYYCGAIIGFALTLPAHPVSTLWPPNAILLSFLLLVPPRKYMLVFLGAFPAHLAVQLQSDVPSPMILLWFISNSAEALIGASCLRFFFKGPVDLFSRRSIGLYVAFAALLAPFLSSFLDAGFVALVGWKNPGFWQVWLTRFPSNVLAALTIPPVILLSVYKIPTWFRDASWRTYTEALFLIGGLLVVSVLVFVFQMVGTTTPAWLYLPLPFLLWAAMRFGSTGVSMALLIVVLTSISGAANGLGPFLSSSPAQNVFDLQMYLVAISLPLLFLAGVIEEQRDKTKTLSESESWFRTMANTAPVMIWLSSSNDRGIFFNKSWLDFTGLTQDQEIASGWMANVHKDDIDRCRKIYRQAYDQQQEFSLEYRLRRYDGQYCWMLANGAPRFTPDGMFLGHICCAIEISERKRAEAELLLQRQELAHVNRVSTLGELAASLAHELNQPLTAILSNAQAAQRFLSDGSVDIEEIREILTDIVYDDNRAGEVIRGMRALAKKGELELSSIDLAGIISEIASLVHSDAVLRGVRVRLDVHPALPAARGDKVQVQQVLLNLLLNAFDAMKDSPPDERLVSVRAELDTDMVRIAIRDHGNGLTRDQYDKVFQPFFTTKRDGLGMGLSITRTIVERHGGRLWAENNSDRGATFYFTVPVDDREGQLSEVEGSL